MKISSITTSSEMSAAVSSLACCHAPPRLMVANISGVSQSYPQPTLSASANNSRQSTVKSFTTMIMDRYRITPKEIHWVQENWRLVNHEKSLELRVAELVQRKGCPDLQAKPLLAILKRIGVEVEIATVSKALAPLRVVVSSKLRDWLADRWHWIEQGGALENRMEALLRQEGCPPLKAPELQAALCEKGIHVAARAINLAMANIRTVVPPKMSQWVMENWHLVCLVRPRERQVEALLRLKECPTFTPPQLRSVLQRLGVRVRVECISLVMAGLHVVVEPEIEKWLLQNWLWFDNNSMIRPRLERLLRVEGGPAFTALQLWSCLRRVNVEVTLVMINKVMTTHRQQQRADSDGRLKVFYPRLPLPSLSCSEDIDDNFETEFNQAILRELHSGRGSPGSVFAPSPPPTQHPAPDDVIRSAKRMRSENTTA